MPDPASPKAHVHPFARRTEARPVRPVDSGARFAELAVTSNFSFLRGASHPDELVQQAAELGYSAIGIADRNSLAGVVRAHVAAKEAGIPLVVGCRLCFQEEPGFELLVYPTSRAAYGRLCRLLTTGKRRAPKGECLLTCADLIAQTTDLLAVVMLDNPAAGVAALRELKEHFDDDRLSLAVSWLYGPDAVERQHQHTTLSRATGIPMVASNDVHYHIPGRGPLQDVLTCIRHGCTLAEAGFRLFPNHERYLKPPREMERLCVGLPGALERSAEIAARAASFTLDQLRYDYPDELCPTGLTPLAYLEQLTWAGAHGRYPDGIPTKVADQLRHEFALIETLHFAPYFLTVHDIVTFARGRGILCQGRGAAANSAVCYCLGVTAVDPARIDVLFERFVSVERREPPDIDIDFEHERREEVIQYLYEKYGRERAGLTAEVITYRGRSAVRDVGKTLGLSLDLQNRVTRQIGHWDDRPLDGACFSEAGVDAETAAVGHWIEMVNALVGFPRHLSQHVGGFVITRGPLCELVPIENAAMENRTVIEWDKDDIDAMGMLKVDVLGLGMLTCLRKGLTLIEEQHGRRLTLATIPAEDPAVYDAICAADTLGVFQIESRAQMTMLPRLKPRCFYDLVIEVAIVRPGPIVGDMVHPYLRRRNGEEEVIYPSAAVQRILQKTLGIPLFQEQAMSLAMVAAGFSAGEAEMLRRTISAWKSRGKDAIPRYQKRFIEGMLTNGYTREFAEQCFARLKGFSEYGFPESHSASFALLVYASAWLKRYYPAAFAAALLNSQPMGFYAPAQIVRDARDHGVEVLPVDVNHSAWDCTLENNGEALRLGMRMVRSLRETDAARIARAVAEHGPFRSIAALWQQTGIATTRLRPLALADGFSSLGLTRQHALWNLQQLRGKPLPLLDAAPPENRDESSAQLPLVSEPAEVIHDYRAVGLSLKNHPMAFLRVALDPEGVLTVAQIKDEQRCPHGCVVTVAGIVLVRQRPSTAKGILFMTLEDETGRIDLIIRPHISARFRTAALFSQFITAHGRVERQGIVVHILPRQLKVIATPTDELPNQSRDFR